MCQMLLSVLEVNPIPTAKEREAMTIFLWLKPQEAIICIPDTTMLPNIMMVHPPKTLWGREAKKCPTGGRSPAKSMATAPVAMVKRFTTLVIAIRPTFWEKEVTGAQPKSPEMLDPNPSHAREPEISFSVISLFSPEATMAVVSPMVSAAETRKIIQTERMAPILNCGVKGKSLGRDTKPSEKIRLKSTLPINMERIYPTIKPANTESCFI